MLYVALSSVLAAAVAGGVYFLWDWIGTRTRQKVAKEVVEREMTKILDKAEADKAAVPDPERTLTKEEADAVLKRIHALGNRPL